ncbi:unnamed protein product [Tuber aestivum]|uniref:Uncharacterized protein n=1 Tax=Tuber aestivum TaxID=59557 RepID=A0A292PVE5_9PEZI|nr:unnamed protein product [Tuber aestivum]
MLCLLHFSSSPTYPLYALYLRSTQLLADRLDFILSLQAVSSFEGSRSGPSRGRHSSEEELLEVWGGHHSPPAPSSSFRSPSRVTGILLIRCLLCRGWLVLLRKLRRLQMWQCLWLSHRLLVAKYISLCLPCGKGREEVREAPDEERFDGPVVLEDSVSEPSDNLSRMEEGGG